MGAAYSRIAFFLSGHGFGHGVRNAALIDALPAGVEVFIFTSLPESFFQEELSRPWTLIPCELEHPLAPCEQRLFAFDRVHSLAGVAIPVREYMTRKARTIVATFK